MGFFPTDGTFRDGSVSLAESGGRLYQRWHEVVEVHYAGEKLEYTSVREHDTFYSFANDEDGGDAK